MGWSPYGESLKFLNVFSVKLHRRFPYSHLCYIQKWVTFIHTATSCSKGGAKFFTGRTDPREFAKANLMSSKFLKLQWAWGKGFSLLRSHTLVSLFSVINFSKRSFNSPKASVNSSQGQAAPEGTILSKILRTGLGQLKTPLFYSQFCDH